MNSNSDIPSVFLSFFSAAVIILFGLLVHTVSADEIEIRVREYFSDAPVMVEVARCESGFRQHDETGAALYGGSGNRMVGVFQIYADVHRSAAQALGYDIDTLEGNMAYARHLYEKSGTDPWVSSLPCWHQEDEPKGSAEHAQASTTTISEDRLTMQLTFGMRHPQIRTLQETLNAYGISVASDGPGSPGNETEMFGSLTRDAVRRFQCERAIVCDGNEYSTGYGLVGPSTRAALNGLANGEMAAAASASVSTSDGAATIVTASAHTRTNAAEASVNSYSPALENRENGEANSTAQNDIEALQKKLHAAQTQLAQLVTLLAELRQNSGR